MYSGKQNHKRTMKLGFYKLFSGILICTYLFSIALPGMASASQNPIGDQRPGPVKQEPKRGTNPETGKVSFIGNGDPIFVPGVSDAKGMSSHERALGMADAFGREFGLKDPSQELRLLKSQKDRNGNEAVRLQQMYAGIPVIAGEMVINTNAESELLSISGEVSSDLALDTKPAIKAADARKHSLSEIASVHNVNTKNLTSTNPELWIFDESLLTASTRPAELVWRMEVTAKDSSQPIRQMVLVNAQTGEISFHINQVDTAEQFTCTSTPLSGSSYFDMAIDEVHGRIFGSDANDTKLDVFTVLWD